MPAPISLFDISALEQALDQQTLVLTPNQRLASRIINAYGIAKARHGAAVVDRPQVLAIDHWLDQCWQQLLMQADPEVLNLRRLSPQQEGLLWEQVIVASELGQGLLRSTATATQVASACQQLGLWMLDPEASQYAADFAGNPDAEACLAWRKDFVERCRADHWLTKLDCQQQVLQAFTDGRLPSVGSILGVGFESLAPLHIKILTAAGQYQPVAQKRRESAVQRFSAASAEQELQAAAVWAKQQLRNDEQQTVAVVVPDLNSRREQVLRIFQEVFEPEYMQPQQPRRAQPFNLSAGAPLAEMPLVDVALDLLALCVGKLETDKLLALLQSPFIQPAEGEESQLAYQLQQLLLSLKQFVVSHADLRYCADKVAAERDWVFARQLHQQANLLRAADNKKPQQGEYWAGYFVELLTTLGYPGERQLDSLEYQQFMQLQQSVTKLASLSDVSGPITFTEAVSQLRSLCSKQVFQPKTPESRLQILGLLEAAGLEFDSLWLCSVNDKLWPAAPSPNPFIPLLLQQRLDMPHASAMRELEYAQHLKTRFLGSASQVVVSYASFEEGNEMALSPLFVEFPSIDEQQLLGRSLQSLLPLVEIQRRHIESSRIEYFEPGLAPALQTDEVVKGGSRIFASQAACPFRAFAQHRLQINPPFEPELGLNAADRGTLFHRCMELFWKTVNSLQALSDMDEQLLKERCQQAVDYAVNELQQRKPKLLGIRYKALEQQRLLQLMQAWLKVERQRADFVVKHLEYRQTIQFAELQVNVQIDRVDQLADGRWLLMDYKTGKSSINRWWGDRPDEPQLPLYAILLNQNDTVGGLSFAEASVEGCSLKGIGADDLAESSLQWRDKSPATTGAQSWPQLLEKWQTVLMALANDFIQGIASVDPKKAPQSCQFCHLQTVCRVGHQVREGEVAQ
jgi:probable DNA repair protein